LEKPPEHLLRLVHDLQELRIKVADEGCGHGGQDPRVDIARTGPEQDARRRIQLTGL
jgi:hypothetical protein